MQITGSTCDCVTVYDDRMMIIIIYNDNNNNNNNNNSNKNCRRWISHRTRKDKEKTAKYGALRWEMMQHYPGYSVLN